MIIDGNLRAAIRSAEKSQPHQNYELREKQEGESIAAFLKTNPAKAKRVHHLIRVEEAASKKASEARSALCEDFGLRRESGKIKFAHCDEGKKNFVKAGGKLPEKAAQRFTFDKVMAEVAAADDKEAVVILKKYGINWK